MFKYNEKDKREVINLIEKENYSIRAAAKKLGISKSVVMRWWQAYEIHGEASFSMKSRKYTSEFKLEVVKYMHDNYLSPAEASAMFGIPGSSTVFHWERIYSEGGEKCLLAERPGRSRKGVMKMDKDNSEVNLSDEKSKENLILEIKKLKAEVAYLKKSIALKEERMSLKAKKKHR